MKKPTVNKNCIWCGACISIADEVFDFNEEWYSIIKKLDSYENKWVDDAISACPVNAISWEK